ASAVFERGPKVRQRLVDGVEALGTLPRSEQGSRRLYVVIAAFVVIGNDVDVLVRPLGEEVPDGVRRAHMETAPLRQELLQIGNFLDQRMAERMRDIGIDPAPLQKALIRQVVEIGLKR